MFPELLHDEVVITIIELPPLHSFLFVFLVLRCGSFICVEVEHMLEYMGDTLTQRE